MLPRLGLLVPELPRPGRAGHAVRGAAAGVQLVAGLVRVAVVGVARALGGGRPVVLARVRVVEHGAEAGGRGPLLPGVLGAGRVWQGRGPASRRARPPARGPVSRYHAPGHEQAVVRLACLKRDIGL